MHEIAQNCVCNAQKIISIWGYPAVAAYDASPNPPSRLGSGEGENFLSVTYPPLASRFLVFGESLKYKVPLPEQFYGSAPAWCSGPSRQCFNLPVSVCSPRCSVAQCTVRVNLARNYQTARSEHAAGMSRLWEWSLNDDTIGLSLIRWSAHGIIGSRLIEKRDPNMSSVLNHRTIC